ncbi:MAG: L,D-transpeptidase family protein [Fibrobacterota bacterium]
MTNQIKRLVLFRIKSLEFKYRTWKNKREIAHAYEGEKPPLPRRLPPAVNIRRVATVIGLIFLLCITGYGLYTVGTYMKDIDIAFPSVKNFLEKKRQEETVAKTTREGMETDAPAEAAKPKVHSKSENKSIDKPSQEGSFLDTIPELVMVTDQDSIARSENAFNVKNPMNHVILANKAERTMYLLERTGSSWSTRESFHMAIGANDGAKERDGDKKTPEGLYFIIGRKEGSELNEIYGPLAYVLNYPNAEDRIKGRTGQGIWIHGTAPDSFPVQTRGCLELENENIQRLSQVLNIGIGTPVYIVELEEFESPSAFPSYTEIEKRREKILEQYNRNQNFFARVVIDWKKAWESQEISFYEKFYDHQRFFGQGLAWDGWRERKIRTFNAYETIRVECNDILLTDFSESTAVVKFIQRYQSDLLEVEGGKKLSLIKGREGWKIIGESTFPKEELLL